MPIRTQMMSVIALAVLVWIVLLQINGTEVNMEMVAPFSATVAIVTALALFFEKVAWKWPLINGFLVHRPLLAGTWEAELVSSYLDDNGNPTKKTVYVVIQQTLTTISVRLYTDKARSFSIAQRIWPADGNGLFELAIVYQNVPDIQHRQDTGEKQIHFGALHLTDILQHPVSIAGPYWTDRCTNGHLKLVKRKSERISSYEQGVALFG